MYFTELLLWTRSSARLEYWPFKPGVEGSNPSGSTLAIEMARQSLVKILLATLIVGATILTTKENPKSCKEAAKPETRQVQDSNESQEDYLTQGFRLDYETVMWGRVLGERMRVENTVDKMLTNYSSLSEREQEQVKPYVEGGLFFLKGGYKSIREEDAFRPYAARACELGLDAK